MPWPSRVFTAVLTMLVVMAGSGTVWGQSEDAADGASPMVELNLPKNVDLTVLVEYIGKRLGMNVIYDEQLTRQKVTLVAPEEVPADSLRGLLDSILAMKGTRRGGTRSSRCAT